MNKFAGGIALAFESRNYRLFWVGQLVNNLSVWINRAGIQWLAWELTQSFAWLGVIGAASMVPTLIFGPIAGTAADRYGHRRQLQTAASIGAGGAFLMCGVTLAGWMSAELLLGLTLIGGTTRAFTVPARNALVHSLVDHEHLSAAIGMNAATYQGSIFIGAAIGGAVVIAAGAGATFFIYGVSTIFAVVMIGLLDIEPHSRKGGERTSFLTELADGFRYAIAHGGIRTLLFMSMLMALCVQPYQEMLSGIAAEIFKGGPGIYTLLFLAGGLGSMIGGLWIARRGRTQGLSRVTRITSITALVGLSVFSLSPYLWLSVAAAIVTGTGLVVTAAAAMSLIQNAVDQEVRARVLSMASVIAVGAPALSAIAIGALASRLGVQGPLFSVALAGICVWLVLSRAVRRHGPGLESLDNEAASGSKSR